MGARGDAGAGRARLRTAWESAVDQLAGSDPGLNRLRVALRGTFSVGVAIVAEYVFVKLTGALQRPVPAGPAGVTAAAANHDLLVVAELLGAMVGLVTALGVNETTTRREALWLAVIPVPMAATVVLGLALGPHRAAALASFPVVLAIAGLARRWGPRGGALAMPLFIGDFIGFFLHEDVHLRDVGWLDAEIGVAAVAVLVLRMAAFRPDPVAGLRRAQRSWLARSRRVARLAERQFRAPSHATEAALRRQLTRLNESSLIIDAQLAEPGALAVGSSARRLHERLFEAELGVSNAARFASALTGVVLPGSWTDSVDRALAALRGGDPEAVAEAGHAITDRLSTTAADELASPQSDIGRPLRRRRVLLHRFGSSLALAGDALGEWMPLGEAARCEDEVYRPAVALSSGWLPGSAVVSAQASRVPVWARSAAQLAVAVGVATLVGDAISPSRYYWAVIASFVALTGTNTSIEQVRKAGQRVIGTMLGILAGSLLAGAVGTSVPGEIAVVLASLFLGLYLLRLNYAAMTVAITIIVSQLYEQLHELSGHLLILRLGETAAGATVAALTVLVVLPLRTTRVVDLAADRLIVAVRAFVADAVEALTAGGVTTLSSRSREVDAAFQALATTAAPLRHLGATGRRAQRLVASSAALRHYSRNLAADIPTGHPCSLAEEVVAMASRVLLDSMDALTGDGEAKVYVRSAGPWSEVEQLALDALRRHVGTNGEVSLDIISVMLAARDFQLLDGALVDIAELRGAEVRSLDTDPATVAAH